MSVKYPEIVVLHGYASGNLATYTRWEYADYYWKMKDRVGWYTEQAYDGKYPYYTFPVPPVQGWPEKR